MEKLVFYSLYSPPKREFKISPKTRDSSCNTVLQRRRNKMFLLLNTSVKTVSFLFTAFSRNTAFFFFLLFNRSSQADTYCFRAREYKDTRQKNFFSFYALYSRLIYNTEQSQQLLSTTLKIFGVFLLVELLLPFLICASVVPYQ